MPVAPEFTKLRHSITDTLTDTSAVSVVYAVVGATDLAVEKVREARERALATRTQIDVSELPVKAAAGINRVAVRVPSIALDGTRVLTHRTQDSYGQLADRGHRLVSRVRGQKATQDLLSQAGSTVSRGKAAVTSVRRAALDTRRSAKATVTTARRDADVVAHELADEAQIARARARRSSASTTSAAKRTATTARKRTGNVQRATKAANTSARKTAAAVRTAAAGAAAKVGD